MKNENMKPKIGKRLFAMLLALVMIVGLVDGFSVKAATDVDLAEATFAYNKHNPTDDQANPTSVYLTVSGNTDYNSIQDQIYKISAEDTESGVFLGSTKISSNVQVTGSKLLKIPADNVSTINANGDKLVVKGKFIGATNSSYSITIPTLELVFDSTNKTWSVTKVATEETEPEEEETIPTVAFTTFDQDGYKGTDTTYPVAKTIRFLTKTSYQTSHATWQLYTAADDESGVWRGDSDTPVTGAGLYHPGGGKLRIYFGATDDESTYAQIDEIITVEGVFTYTDTSTSKSYSFRVEKTKFKFTGTTWEIVEEEEEKIIHPVTFLNYDTSGTLPGKYVYFNAVDTYAEEVLPWEKWPIYYADTEENASSGIWLGDTPVETGYVVKTSTQKFRIYFGATDDTLATEGTEVTIQGVFTYEDASTSASYSFSMEKTTFRYNGTTWDIVIEQVAHDVVVKEIQTGDTLTTRVYFTSVDTYTEYKVDGTKDTKNTWKDYKADTEQDAKSGIWRGETLVEDGSLYWTGNRNFVIKFGATNDTPATEGETVTIRGVFEYTYKASVPKDSISYSFRIEETTFCYNGANWEIVEKRGDFNSDRVVDIRDLVRLKKYIANPDKVQIATDATYNQDGVINYEDADDLRWALVAGYSYDVATGIPLGLPVYSNSKTLERMAYSAPQVGTIEDNVFTPRSDADIDKDLQKYKAAGFTLISSAGVASYPSSITGADYEARLSALETLMKAADRNDLKVLVHLNYINDLRYQYLLDYDVSNIAYANVIKNHATAAAQYSAFAGFLLGDEWTACEAELYEEIITILKNVEAEMKAAGTLKEDMIITTSQYPVSTFDEETITLFGNSTNSNFTKTGVEVLTGDANSAASKEDAYKTYLSKFTENGMFTFDLYPLSWHWSNGLYVDEDWFDNLKYVASTGLWKTGVTIQSCQIGSNDGGYYRYAPEEKEDISFQMYTALAYGMKSINYYCYNASSDSDIVDYITNNENIYNAVKVANAELELFDNVLMNFKWKGALDLQASKTGVGTAANSERLASAVLGSGSARTIIGCMKDIYGFDGYMVANAARPRTSTSSEVTLTFNNADKVIVYENGVPTTKELSDGVITISVGVGEGIFVIPVKNN